MSDYIDDYITGKIEQQLREKLSPATKKALRESKEKSRAIKAAGNTRIGNLAGGGLGGMFGVKNR